MKKMLIVLMAAALMYACNSNSRTADDKDTATNAMAAEWVEVVINVDGMTCDGCEKAIKAGVESLKGIQSVESSHEEGWTRVSYDKNLTSLEDIEGKITQTGYVVKGEKEDVSL